MGTAHTTEKTKMPEELKNLSNFSPGFINKLKDKLESSTQQFSLDRESLKSIFNCSNSECDVVFDFFDLNGDKKIDSYEFLCALTMLSSSTLEEKAEILFNFYDFDKSQYITRDELVILLTNALTALNAMSKKDPPKIKEIEHETDDFFTKADLNNDNKITLKEFKSYLKKDPTILNILMNFNIAKMEDLGTDFGGGDLPECDSDLEREINPPELSRNSKIDKAKQGVDFSVAEGEGGLFASEDIGGGDEFMAVKPWKGVIDNSVPSNYKPSKADSEPPDANLKLEYVYGYRCHDVRNNLRYTPDDHFIYHTAALGIKMNPVKNTQTFHFGHKDDIMSFALHPNGQFVATGEIGPKPLISVWSVETMQMITSFNAPLTKGISQLTFSPSGKYLAAGAMDDDH
jgi:Ca2+-binding EF-hand superfamily protein